MSWALKHGKLKCQDEVCWIQVCSLSFTVCRDLVSWGWTKALWVWGRVALSGAVAASWTECPGDTPQHIYSGVRVEGCPRLIFVWTPTVQQVGSTNYFGITGPMESSVHAQICVCKRKGICSPFHCSLPIRGTKRQQNKQNVAFIQILTRVESSGRHCLYTALRPWLQPWGRPAGDLGLGSHCWGRLIWRFSQELDVLSNGQGLVCESW